MFDWFMKTSIYVIIKNENMVKRMIIMVMLIMRKRNSEIDYFLIGKKRSNKSIFVQDILKNFNFS